jgi:diguanylate cyclase (GGDEF)-like protein
VAREIRSYLKVRAKLLAGWLALSLAVVTACWAILQRQEEAEVTRFSERAATSVRIVEQTFRRTMDAALALHELAQERVLAVARGEPTEAIDRYIGGVTMFERSGIIQVATIGPAGWLTWSSVPGFRSLDLSARTHFQIHATGGSRQVEIGAPLIGEMSGRWSVQISKALHNATGQFAGVSVVSVDPVLLSTELLLQMSEEGTTTVIRRLDGGAMIARNRNPAASLGRSADPNHPVFLALKQSSEGSLRFQSTPDGRKVITYYQVLRGLGVVAIVGIDEYPALAPFRLLSRIVWTSVGAGLVGILVAGELLGRIARMRRRLEYQATRDPLTGLYNRRFLDGMAQSATAKAVRGCTPFSVLLADLDHFKKLNDTWGHAAGDLALRETADCISAAVRSSDIVCRYGGEEFLVLLPGCDFAGATKFAETIRARIAGLRAASGGASPSVTASVGVASFPAHGTTAEMVIRSADEALYRAKREGRNRIACASAPPDTAARPVGRGAALVARA